MSTPSITIADLSAEERSQLLGQLVEANPWLIDEKDLWWARARTLRERASKELDRYMEASRQEAAAAVSGLQARTERARLAADTAKVRAREAARRYFRAYQRFERQADAAWHRAYPAAETA